MVMRYVYIIQNKNDDFIYVGLTNDLKRRFSEHNKGKVHSTKNHLPLEIIYYEAHRDKYDAAAREQFLKTGWGKNWIKRTLKRFLNQKSWEENSPRVLSRRR